MTTELKCTCGKAIAYSAHGLETNEDAPLCTECRALLMAVLRELAGMVIQRWHDNVIGVPFDKSRLHEIMEEYL